MISEELSGDVIQSAIDFVWNVQNRNVAGAGEMPIACDVSFLALRASVNQYKQAYLKELGKTVVLEPQSPLPILVEAKVFDALRDCVMAYESTFIDWDRMNEHSPDYDPSYKPKFPECVTRANEALTFLRPV